MVLPSPDPAALWPEILQHNYRLARCGGAGGGAWAIAGLSGSVWEAGSGHRTFSVPCHWRGRAWDRPLRSLPQQGGDAWRAPRPPPRHQIARLLGRRHRRCRDGVAARAEAALYERTLFGGARGVEVTGVLARSTDEAQKAILKGLDLTIREGEVHAVMGPNGSGKSTLAKVLIGDPTYEVTDGQALLDNQSLFDMEPHERALAGLFLAFQSPPAVNGVSNLDFLRASYNAKMRAREEPELDVIEFYGLITQKLEELKINPDFLNRSVNEGFSGGERKRNEMLQMSVLEPRLAILDEIDSGLDIDALKDVADAIARVRRMDSKRSLLVVTHFERFLKYVDADVVHVMHQGRIVKSGGRDLSQKLDAEGYDWILQESR
eukprot:CAMPEP_0179070832 /NCGR_PEP_ID=MMETSP0796-20121207/31222_1 /TAXON_ID=73915 /ORGANISM="Pyrodinium bahamense, Strain pbaha01" /LENGTH=376 /DNA_ID=CAMNT_0020767933 /DNA_START=85 /DNA_END=1216 /DNA_ORIENTATION=+